jgi:rhodanese-related sulfurtransferase
MKLINSLAVIAALAVPALALACDDDARAEQTTVKKVTIAELAKLNKDHKAVVLDANGSETRAKFGVIPNAKLLTSAVNYDVAKELPAAKDSKLVFYCANTMCSASHQAAEKAASAGYTDVSVLPDGIKGWKDAGQPVQQPNRS